MIKFFRHIRKSLISENKMGKYFKYAIGEILLVVIGILIALQINNWNNKRVEEARADKFLQKLKTQLKYNIIKTEERIKEFDSIYKASIELIDIIGEKNVENLDEKINKLVNLNLRDYHLNLDMNIITEGRENGDIALLASDKIRQALYFLSTENTALIERERITNEDLNLLFVPYLNKNMNLRNRIEFKNIGKSKLYKDDNYKMLFDQDFENYIISRLEYNQSNLVVYRNMKQHLESLSQLLETK
ncbi:DUF6090 family protein [Winogradskyella vincentii]|uniref:Uncharacterized protein n=1 Tax=Winogradskyella vincentii TaxID=2877122 RepID=A0ABS7Y3B7_9FLAO|nr:DUF6090 family protein [Winogradskyella vincentii]MCA0154406.1 hypothetical protein [Winogradskyella vincentii]